MMFHTHGQPAHVPRAAQPGADFEHAVVIGGSIAGLTAARVLADYFQQVTVLERDVLATDADNVSFRSGAPQARHAHMLLPRGQDILEALFPGFTADLRHHGAIDVHAGDDIVVFEKGMWRNLPPSASPISIASSRPLLEDIVRRYVRAHPRIRLLHGVEATGLVTDTVQRRVQGVTIRERRPGAQAQVLAASLVLDASGRGSRAPQWLQQMDYCPPQEWTINAFVGYTTRLYRIPDDFAETWKVLHMRLDPPDHTRGGIILPMEENRWQVALVGIARDHPPVDHDGFMEFARSLPSPRLYEALVAAEPLGAPYGYRHTANRLRRYDRMPCYLDGFLVCGDAVCTLNPIYALGMTAAIAAGPALQEALQAHRDNLTGLAAHFQQQLNEAIARYWRIATHHDWDWPLTEVDDNEIAIEQEVRS